MKKTKRLITKIIIPLTVLCLTATSCSASNSETKKEQSLENNTSGNTYSTAENPSNDQLPSSSETSDEESDKNTESQIDLNNLVKDAYSYEIDECKYAIPEINLTTGNADNINKEIYEKYRTVIDKAIRDNEEGVTITDTHISYEYFLNDDVLSLIIEKGFHANEVKSLDVYNISISEGVILSDDDIIEKCNLTTKQYKEEAEKAITLFYWDMHADMLDVRSDDPKYMEKANENIAMTISESNMKNIRPYIGENGDLYVAAFVYQLAGPEANDYKVLVGSFNNN